MFSIITNVNTNVNALFMFTNANVVFMWKYYFLKVVYVYECKHKQRVLLNSTSKSGNLKAIVFSIKENILCEREK